MRRRHPRSLPGLWLMTDERQGEALWAAIATLPHGSGIVFRHYGLSARARRTLFARVMRAARRRGLLVMLAGSPALAKAWGADGAHGWFHRPSRETLQSIPVHDRAELRRARHADFVFLSPVFPTRSHPGADSLGVSRFRALAARAKVPVIALGGVNRANAKSVIAAGAYGWAAIDGLTPGKDQKRKAVPR